MDNPIRRFLVLLMVTAVAGCESLPRGELYFQAAHAVDVLQTYNGPGSDPCYKETNPITREIIGEHPSQGDVLLWGVGMAVGHYLISRQLEEHAPAWALTAWQMVTFGSSAYTVYDNHRTGIRPWGDNKHLGSNYANPRCSAYAPQ